jgi:hypothetical protein
MPIVICTDGGQLDPIADNVVAGKEKHDSWVDKGLGWKSNGLLKGVLTGKSIFIVGRGCKGSISCENEIRDLRVMRERIN